MDLDTVNTYIERVEQSEKKNLDTANGKLKVGVDLGTAFIVIVVLDENDNPIACEKQAAHVLRDGVVVDFMGASRIVTKLKHKLEERLGRELTDCAIAIPAGTENSVKTHVYVAESAGFEVIRILDEPSAANALYNIENGVIVDIGGGTTGLAIIKNGKVVEVADEPSGGLHLSLVIAGNLGIEIDEAEEMKMNPKNYKDIFPIVKPVIEKMAAIVKKHIINKDANTIYLCGGTCCLAGVEQVFEKEIGLPVIKPDNPFLVTPTGIAMNCFVENQVEKGA